MKRALLYASCGFWFAVVLVTSAALRVLRPVRDWLAARVPKGSRDGQG